MENYEIVPSNAFEGKFDIKLNGKRIARRFDSEEQAQAWIDDGKED